MNPGPFTASASLGRGLLGICSVGFALGILAAAGPNNCYSANGFSNALSDVHAYLANGTKHSPKPLTNEVTLVFDPAMTLQRIIGRRDDLDSLVDEIKSGAFGSRAAKDVFETNNLWKSGWTPSERAKDGIYEAKPMSLSLAAFGLDQRKWPRLKDDAMLYGAAIFIASTNLLHLIEQEKTLAMYEDSNYKHTWRDGVTRADFDPHRFFFSNTTIGEPRLWFDMKFSGRPKFGGPIDLTMHFRQTLRTNGLFYSEFYSTSAIAQYYAEVDELHPMLSALGYGYLVVVRLTVKLAHPLDGDSGRQRQIRQALGNWKRFSEYFGSTSRVAKASIPGL